MAGIWAVYTLSDHTGVRYVGVSKKPENRLARHISEAKRGKTHRHNWLKSLPSPPRLDVVEWVDNWDAAERQWIAHYRAQGCDLVNGNDGGRTMHQARVLPTYPNVKKAWRIMDGTVLSMKRRGTPEQLASVMASRERFGAAIAKLRARGQLQHAEDYYRVKYAK